MMSSKRFRGIFENLLFVWLGLSVVLLLGGQNLVLPNWLQIIGRSHPLLLHFPIVLILFGVLFQWIPGIDNNADLKNFGELSLLVGVNFAGLTVIAGLILAQEDYSGNTFDLHQYSGFGVFILGALFYFFRNLPKTYLKATSLVLAIGITFTGHWGANLTHGEDFLLAPILQEEVPTLAINDAQVFEDVVMPILETKCVGCHKEGKIKGKLRLDHITGIQTGGKTGPFVVAGNLDESLMVQRINLPLEHDDHMPPKNKAQLTDEEKKILVNWVLAGAEFDKKLIEMEPESEFFKLASLNFDESDNYNFEEADPSTVEELNNFFRKVEPLYPGSPALVVSYFGIAAFDPSSLNELDKIRTQVVQLNLNKMPLAGTDLSILQNFINLEELQASFTDLDSEQILSISQIPSLKDLSISGNKLSEKSLDYLSGMSDLRNLYLWETGLSDDQQKQLSSTLKYTNVEFGFDSKKVVYELNPPLLKSEKDMFGDSTLLEINHPIPSVEIRYTLDGSEPDSINSLKYEAPFWVKKTAEIKARAFADDWKGSPEASTLVFKAGNPPKELKLLTQPNAIYFGKGNLTLIDQIKGKPNHTSGEWLGYQDNHAEFVITLAENQKPKEITISLLYNEGAYIFPPTQVEIWQGDGSNWNKVIDEKPLQPKNIQPTRFEALTYGLPETDFDQIRVRLKRIASLPPWHPGAGSKGWVFLDEVSLLE
ncbi:FN3 associated domain-containing protein [Algoriphagus sediminis]|uniref:FN3 associated domain-containing protein n=1 Tax=Algoriphagus sediminis TaxID=3057113 RepID=A0ABT7YAE8_9BACT|nr:FN3 associated domain-containing protein [Algoriphagus sediminis]MDN3203500.1 FN3 associated domain-containing protein [Algoriphagus sediminis]